MIRHATLFGIFMTAALMCAPAGMAQGNDFSRADEFYGNWALDLNGGAGWLNVRQEDGYLDASILWHGGSVVPVANVYLFQDRLIVTRLHEVAREKVDGKVVHSHTLTEALYIKVDDQDPNTIICGRGIPRNNGLGVEMTEFTGTRIPAHGPAPDLSKLEFGEPVELFNGKDLSGWELTNPNQVNGWSVKNGILVNDPVQKKGEPHISYGNLRTEQEFEDFNLTLDVRVLPNGNSGIYLRGIYEVQVADTYGKPLDSHHMGGIYSRITPSVNAEKPAGEWQSYDITLCDRYVTVILNGTTIIDNEPVMGCTGGALTADEFSPGPIYLQGDHTGVEYKNIVLKPITGKG